MPPRVTLHAVTPPTESTRRDKKSTRETSRWTWLQRGRGPRARTRRKAVARFHRVSSESNRGNDPTKGEASGKASGEKEEKKERRPERGKGRERGKRKNSEAKGA